MRKKILYILAIICCSLVRAETDKPLYFSDDMVYIDGAEIEERKGIYTLNIKGIPVNYTYELIKEDGKYYFPVISFFQSIGMKNYKKEGHIIKFFLGNNLEEHIVDASKEPKTDYIMEDNDIYLIEEKFREYFTQRLELDPSKLLINMATSFYTPEDINILLDSTEKKLKEEADKPTLVYENERELLGVGNLKVNLETSIVNGKEDTKKNDWEGSLEYNGPLLYGSFLSQYDLKEHKFGDSILRYDNVYDGNYDLEVGIYGEEREKGLTFKKDKGYYEEGKNIIITEKVPLGSRVELLFGGIPIEIAYEKNGEVTFVNSLIKSNRSYKLKIYTPDGIITEREIKITDDYDQQNKGEFGYDVQVREDKLAKSVNSDINIFYGVTNNLTLGLGYGEYNELMDGDYYRHRDLKGQVIYSNFLLNNNYTLKLEGEKSISEENRFSKKYTYGVLLDTNIFQNLNLKIEEKNNGEYYGEKKEQYLDLTYDITNNLSLNYAYEKIKLYDNTTEKDYSYGIQLDQSWNSLLVNLEARNNRKNEKEYIGDLYYTGFDYVITKWSNKIDSQGNYESAFKVMNKSWDDTLEYSFETKYSSKDKDIYTLDFKLKLDNWFEVGTYLEKNGTNRNYMGIDKVFDLKNPQEKIDDLDSSRLKLFAFIDSNNNNKYDLGEKPTGNIEVKLGEETIVTDDKGEGNFYGIPSNGEYDLEINSLIPTLSGKKNKIKVKGYGAGTIMAYIPIKAQVEIDGMVNINLKNLNEVQKTDIYNQTLITIKNSDGSYNKSFYIDGDGSFYVTDILGGIYNVTLSYEGTDYKFKEINKDIELIYGANKGANEVYLTLEVE